MQPNETLQISFSSPLYRLQDQEDRIQSQTLVIHGARARARATVLNTQRNYPPTQITFQGSSSPTQRRNSPIDRSDSPTKRNYSSAQSTKPVDIPTVGRKIVNGSNFSPTENLFSISQSLKKSAERLEKLSDECHSVNKNLDTKVDEERKILKSHSIPNPNHR